MLVLTRRVNEMVVIGDNIVITIASITESGDVRIGIDAPRDVVVLRHEVYDEQYGSGSAITLRSRCHE